VRPGQKRPMPSADSKNNCRPTSPESAFIVALRLRFG